MTKTVNYPTGDAGDVFTYTVTIAHAGNSSAAAFDLALADPLPSVLQPISVSSSVGTATLDGSTVRLAVPEFLIGDAPIVLTYVVRMTDAIQPGQQVPNLATLTFDSAPGVGGRPDGAEAGALVTGVLGVDVTKEIVATSLPQTGSSQFNRALPDLAIGETVTYRITATLSEGTQHLIITDQLPTGLVPLTAHLVDTGAGITGAPPTISIAGQSVKFDFGTVVNAGNNVSGDSTVVIEIEAQVANTASNVAGRVLDNVATAIVSSPSAPSAPGGTIRDSADAAAEVVTPALALDKSADTPFAAIGQSVTYTIVLTHAPGSTAPAFDIVLADALAPGVMQLVPGSVTTSSGVVLIGNGSGDNSIRISVPELLLGEVVTIHYTVEFIGVPTAQSDAINTVIAEGVTAPGGLPPSFARSIGATDEAAVAISSGGTFPIGAALDRSLLADYELSRPAPLIFAPIYSGVGYPGSTLQITALDASGAPLGVTTTVVGIDGSWIARFPWPIGSIGPTPTASLEQSALFVDRDLGLGPIQPRGSTYDGSANPVYALSIRYTDPTPFVAEHELDPPRLTFDGAYTVRTQVFTETTRIPSIEIDPQAMSLVWNRFARDFASELQSRRIAP